MTAHDPHPRTAAANQARRQSTQQMLHRVQDAIAVLRRQKAPVSVAAIARRAGVSRTFLYENPDARSLAAAALDLAAGQCAGQQTEHDQKQEASWRERALNAEDALKAAHTEIRTQRDRIAILMGQIRDLEQELAPDAIQRITGENAALKQRVRQLAQDNRTLDERLKAARDNGRFADRRIAKLEAELLEQVAEQR